MCLYIFNKIYTLLYRYAAEVFPLLTPILSELGNHLDAIHWTNEVDMNDGQLVSFRKC